MQRVERLGVKAIFLTVDSPVVGNREGDERSKEVLDVSSTRSLQIGDTDCLQVEEKIETVVETQQSVGVAAANTGFINADINWDTIAWLRDVTNLPIVIKGIQSVEDAVTAYEIGVDGIVLSNHGGRSQDTYIIP